jgi:hypothetical protein
LFPLVYHELRKVAGQKMAHEGPSDTLQPTELVHEAWLRLAGNQSCEWQNRAHFFGAAAEARRRILVERAWLFREIQERNPPVHDSGGLCCGVESEP